MIKYLLFLFISNLYILSNDINNIFKKYTNLKLINPIQYINNNVILYEINNPIKIEKHEMLYNMFFVDLNTNNILEYVLISNYIKSVKNISNIMIDNKVNIADLYNYYPVLVHENINNSTMEFIYILENSDMITVCVEKKTFNNINSNETKPNLFYEYVIKNIIVKKSENIKDLFIQLKKFSVGMLIKDISILKNNVFNISIGEYTYYYFVYGKPHDYHECHKEDYFINNNYISIMYILVMKNHTNEISDIIYKPYCCC